MRSAQPQRFTRMTHSPFQVVEDFISPQHCERLIAGLALKYPNVGENGQPLKYERFIPADLAGGVLSEIDALTPILEQRFGAEVIGDPTLLFQQYWENPKAPAEGMRCENSEFKRKKWVKVKDIDLVGFLWLKSYHDAVPLDPRIECYGGKLEFPAYNFSLTPVAGTLVVFPATPHFVTAMSHVMLGSLEQIKIGLKLKNWTYRPENFPGSYQDWFFDV